MSREDTSRRQKAEADLSEAQRAQLDRALAMQLATPEGRLFVRWLLLITAWDEEAMTGNSQTFHNLGAQKVGRTMRDALIAADRKGWRVLEDEVFRDVELKASLRHITD